MTGKGSSGQSSECRPMCACRRSPRRPRSAAVWALPSVVLALVPKCPMCIAAYLALGGGLSVSLATAAHLRIALLWFCWSALALLTVRMVVRFAPAPMKIRTRTRIAAAARAAFRNAWRHIPHLPIGAAIRGAAFASMASSVPLRSTVYGYIKQGHRPQV